MDGVLADGRHGRLWFCRKKDGHALGLMVGDRLLLFRHAVAVVDLSQAQVLTKLVGTAHEIECEICGSVRSWWNDKPALNVLKALYEKEGA
jgi:hypothetical protein